MGIIKSKIISVEGDPGYGKSFFCMFISIFYEESNRIYSNIDFYKNDKRYSKRIQSVEYLEKIHFSKTPGLIIMDEMGGNANSRRSGSSKNMDIVTQLTMYPRKKNCSVVFAAQIGRMLDVYIRDMSFCTIKLLQPHSYYESGEERLMFRAYVIRKGEILKYIEMELFLLFDMGYSFNSLDKSIIDYEKKEVSKKAEKKSGEYNLTKEESLDNMDKIINKIAF